MEKITELQIVNVFQLSTEVYFEKIKKNDAVEFLFRVYGMRPANSQNFINNFKCLMDGKVFKRAMSGEATHYFLEHIYIKYGVPRLIKAIASAREWLVYYEGHYKTTRHNIRAILEKFELLVQSVEDKSELENAFELAVIKSMMDSEENRLNRLKTAPKIPQRVLVPTYMYVRNRDVVATVRLRANGICEQCKFKAPFLRAKDNTPYLEVHHIVQLAKGGEDTVSNAIALCPNCHRELHYGGSS